MSVPAEHIMTAPTLAQLLHGIATAPAIPAAGIASDSRHVRDGYVFFACRGIAGHGLDFAAQARDAGARAIVWDSSTADEPADPGIATIAVDNLAAHLGEIANRYYRRPSDALDVIAVTGTNGKTTVALMLKQCLARLGERCGYVGTLGYGVDELRGAGGLTTPPVIELQGRLAEFVDQNVSRAVLETSSHALSQRRVDGIRFATAIFTNLTRDHLDYHADMQDYFETKAKLFLAPAPRKTIICLDSEYGIELAQRCGNRAVAVSTVVDRVTDGRPYLFVRSARAHEHGSEISFASSWGDGVFTLPMPGEFNVANAALALAYLLSEDIPVDKACAVLAAIDAPAGRMQRVSATGPAVYIDYAHTPNALESALHALRPHCRGKLWCVFGCGGDRDTGKRSLMGELAEQYADELVVTSDNPRDEDPNAIIADILGGCNDPAAVTIIADRADAIAWTVGRCKPDDVILIAGKGHEEYQEVAGKRLPFSDYTTALATLNAAEGGT